MLEVRKKIIIAILLIALISSAVPVQSTIPVYPPATDFQQGYWDNSAGSTAGKDDNLMYFLIKRSVGGDDDEIYYVSDNTYDLRNISFISVNWQRDSDVNGNASMGISSIQASNTFTTRLLNSSDFSTRTVGLGVGSYYNDYYIKVGGETGPSAFPGTLGVYVYDIILHNFSYSHPMNTTGITTTTATLHGKLINDSGTTCKVGFWVGKNSTNSSNFDKNCTLDGSYSAGQTFSYSDFDVAFGHAGPLDPGQYYYVRTWSDNGYNFNVSQNETYFITRPGAPSSFSIGNRSAEQIEVVWKNTTIGSNSNHSVLVHYSTSAPVGTPTPDSYGTFGANESNYDNVTITGLGQETTYYFVAWTYVNDSGSPSMAIFSSQYSTTSNSTVGGIYHLRVRYENESEHGNLPVDLSIWGTHKFIVHYDEIVDEIVFDDGICTSTFTDYELDADDNDTGWVNITTNDTVRWIEFYWNSSNNTVLTCHRTIVPLTAERNLTFYIGTDSPVYGETISKEAHTDYEAVTNPANPVTITTSYDLDEVIGVYVYNASLYGGWTSVPNGNYTTGDNQVTVNADQLDANSSMVRVDYYTNVIAVGVDVLEGSLIKYTYTFKDPSTLYSRAVELDAYAEIYYFNSTGVKQIIDRQFFSSNDEVYPMLLYKKKYRIGVGLVSDNTTIIGLIGLAPTTDNTVPEPIEIVWSTSINYSFFEVIDLTIGWIDGGQGLYVYYANRLLTTNSATIRIYTNGSLVYNETVAQNSYNFTYLTANQSISHVINIEVDTETWVYNNSVNFTMVAGNYTITDILSLDDLLERFLGQSPFQNFETGYVIPWSYMLVGILAFIIAGTFGYFNAHLGMMSTGLWLAASVGFIAGIPVHFAIVGVFLIAMSIIFALGAKQ